MHMELRIPIGSDNVHNWRRREAPTADDWEDHLALFTQLYISESRKLKDVMAIMKRKFDVDAT